MINYNPGTYNAPYVCCECHRSNVRLFRPYRSLHFELVCATCLMQHARPWTYVPAIPMEKQNGYHAIGSTPRAGIIWWIKLRGEICVNSMCIIAIARPERLSHSKSGQKIQRALCSSR